MVDVLRELDRLGLDVSYMSGNEAYIYCPFHADSRKPSMAVSLAGEGWYCFSCEIGGSLKKLEKMLNELDERPKPITQEKRSSEPVTFVRLSKMSIEDYYRLPLAIDCPYLIGERGLTNNTIEEWQIRRSNLFDVFPIWYRGEIIGLNLRAILSTYDPKYQLRPDGFPRKKRIYFNPKIRLEEPYPLIVVEGAIDAVKTWQNGYHKVCATFGTAVDKAQVAIIRRMSGRIFLLYDNETSGSLALSRCFDMFADGDVFVPDPKLYHSKDPGDMEKEELDDIISHPISILKAKLQGMI